MWRLTKGHWINCISRIIWNKIVRDKVQLQSPFFCSNSNTLNGNISFDCSRLTIKNTLDKRGKKMEYHKNIYLKIWINKIFNYSKVYDYYIKENQFEKVMI